MLGFIKRGGRGKSSSKLGSSSAKLQQEEEVLDDTADTEASSDPIIIRPASVPQPVPEEKGAPMNETSFNQDIHFVPLDEVPNNNNKKKTNSKSTKEVAIKKEDGTPTVKVDLEMDVVLQQDKEKPSGPRRIPSRRISRRVSRRASVLQRDDQMIDMAKFWANRDGPEAARRKEERREQQRQYLRWQQFYSSNKYQREIQRTRRERQAQGMGKITPRSQLYYTRKVMGRKLHQPVVAPRNSNDSARRSSSRKSWSPAATVRKEEEKTIYEAATAELVPGTSTSVTKKNQALVEKEAPPPAEMTKVRLQTPPPTNETDEQEMKKETTPKVNNLTAPNDQKAPVIQVRRRVTHTVPDSPPRPVKKQDETVEKVKDVRSALSLVQNFYKEQQQQQQQGIQQSVLSSSISTKLSLEPTIFEDDDDSDATEDRTSWVTTNKLKHKQNNSEKAKLRSQYSHSGAYYHGNPEEGALEKWEQQTLSQSMPSLGSSGGSYQRRATSNSRKRREGFQVEC